MLTVTDSAAAHLATMIDQAEAPEASAARLVARPEGLQLALDQPREGDETIEHDGRTVLLVDQSTAEMLTGRTLDTEQTEQGTVLSVKAAEE